MTYSRVFVRQVERQRGRRFDKVGGEEGFFGMMINLVFLRA